MRLGNKIFRVVFSLVLMCGLGRSVAEAQDASDPVYLALSSRHLTHSKDSLESLAGSKEQLIKKLLELRTVEKPPFVGVRAEKFLLFYAEDAAVAEALESDLNSAELAGLARVLTINNDLLPNSALRTRFARLSVERAKRDPKFASVARALVDSTDSAVSKLARESLDQP